ncbi:hypothetical protein Rs2_20355 [Raphanus sativus]|nr:hypothetical protein Rs2_20355 [Raphanus sativus]
MWGKGKHLEIHMLPTKKSVLVRIPNDFIREKVLLKRLWYVDTAMFHVSGWSEFSEDYTPSLKKIQLWAHLKGVPFDLIHNTGLSHIAGQIGEPKEKDDWTMSLSSISVAHVKVEIDTSIPLPKTIEVGRSDGSFVNVEVEYPWVPPICAHCKEIGHIQRNCLQIPPPAGPSDSSKNQPPPNPPSCYSFFLDSPASFIVGLEAVFRDRPINSPTFGTITLPPKPCITSQNPFAPLSATIPHVPPATPVPSLNPPTESTSILPPTDHPPLAPCSPTPVTFDSSRCEENPLH